ncbi:MAG: hypothetical protein AB7K09_06485 [Planctomycetota bacterium]
MAATHNIVLLGVQGAGKTTWLYRLVASFLEWRGVGRATLLEAQADEFCALAKSEGVNFDEVTERFLKRVHNDIRDHGAVQPTPANSATGHPTITLNFPSLGLEITADDVPGELLMRAAHHNVSKGESAEDPDGALLNFVRQLESRLRHCDGMLFFHPPHQSEIEAESELSLRRFSEMALRVAKNKFLPIVVVFTKDDVWAGGRDTQMAQEQHTRYLTQVAQSEAVMTRREHFCTVVWKTLQDYHQSDLSHPYWAPIAAIFGSGRNFTAISAARGTFAELRSPLDLVQRLDKEIDQFFGRTFVRNMQIAFAALVLFAAITILTLVIIPYAGGVESTVPTFQTPKDVVVWLQEARSKQFDHARYIDGLAGLENALRVAEDQLNGATSVYTEKSFIVYRDFVARLDSFERAKPELAEQIQDQRKKVTDTVRGWLNRDENQAEPAKKPDSWFDVVERYVNDLGPYLEPQGGHGFPEWQTWRDQWREARQLRLEATLERVDKTVTATYYKVVLGVLDNYWRHYVSSPGVAATLSYLRFEAEDPRAVMVADARQFARVADAGEIELTIVFVDLDCPNPGPAFVASSLPKGLIGEVRGPNGNMLRETPLETNDGLESSPRLWRPGAAAEGEEPGVVRINWRPDTPLTLVLVGRDNRTKQWVSYDISRDAIKSNIAPLPGLWPWYYARRTSNEPWSYAPRFGVFHFDIKVPKLPALLAGNAQ